MTIFSFTAQQLQLEPSLMNPRHSFKVGQEPVPEFRSFLFGRSNSPLPLLRTQPGSFRVCGQGVVILRLEVKLKCVMS